MNAAFPTFRAVLVAGLIGGMLIRGIVLSAAWPQMDGWDLPGIHQAAAVMVLLGSLGLGGLIALMTHAMVQPQAQARVAAAIAGHHPAYAVALGYLYFTAAMVPSLTGLCVCCAGG